MEIRWLVAFIKVGPACRGGLRGLAATSDQMRWNGRPNSDVERMCVPRRFALRRKSIPTEWTYGFALRRKSIPAEWTYVGPACRAGLRGLAATSDQMRWNGRQRGDVERMCVPGRFALRRKSIPAEWTYLKSPFRQNGPTGSPYGESASQPGLAQNPVRGI